MVIAPAALARIANVLRLNTANRDYLFILAGVADPDKKQHSDDVNGTVLQIVQQMKTPCYLLDVAWNLVVWNPPAQQLFAGWLGQKANPNLLRFMFLHPLAKLLINSWPLRAKRLVAEFRAESSHYTRLPKVTALLDELLQHSTDFREFWQQQEVMTREGGEREFQHAADGLLHYQQVTFYPSTNLSLKLVVLVP